MRVHRPAQQRLLSFDCPNRCLLLRPPTWRTPQSAGGPLNSGRGSVSRLRVVGHGAGVADHQRGRALGRVADRALAAPCRPRRPGRRPWRSGRRSWRPTTPCSSRRATRRSGSPARSSAPFSTRFGATLPVRAGVEHQDRRAHVVGDVQLATLGVEGDAGRPVQLRGWPLDDAQRRLVSVAGRR